MPRGNVANLKRGGSPGRTKGVPNKATVEIKEIARNLLEDPEYQAALKLRLKRGQAGAVEPLLFQYGYGHPSKTVDLAGTLRILVELNDDDA